MEKVWSGIADLPPGYFAMVMATGIISVACQLFGFHSIALGLVYLNTGFYAILWALVLMRVFVLS